MKSAVLTAIVALAIVFAPSALAAGNGPTKSVYDHKGNQVQNVAAATATTPTPPSTPLVYGMVGSVQLSAIEAFASNISYYQHQQPLFLVGMMMLLVGMGFSLRRLTRKSDTAG